MMMHIIKVYTEFNMQPKINIVIFLNLKLYKRKGKTGNNVKHLIDCDKLLNDEKLDKIIELVLKGD